MSVDSYVYQPLDPAGGEIRLVKLSESRQNSELRCEIITTAVDNAPPYYTLSYRWGQTLRTAPVFCYGVQLNVTPDLEVALEYLRAASYGISTSNLQLQAKYFWIDQLCINQDDKKEREQQVQAMQSVYAHAISTLIWLGPGGNDNDEIFQLLDQVYEQFRREFPKTTVSLDMPFQSLPEAEHKQHGLSELANPVWKRLGQLLSTEWFSRTWVIQEVVQSRNDPMVMLAKSMYSWDKFSWSVSWLQRKNIGTAFNIPQAAWNVDIIAEMRRSNILWSLPALLAETADLFHTTDPRDKIFALVGISADVRGLQSWPDILKPNYSKELHDIHRDVARHIISRDQSLALLSSPSHSERSQNPLSRRFRSSRTDGLPSWVPNWVPTRDEAAEAPTAFAKSTLTEPNQSSVELRYSVQNTAPPTVPLSIQTSSANLLSVGGVKVAKISYTSPKFVTKHFTLENDTVFTEYVHLARTIIPSLSPSALTTSFATTTTCAPTNTTHFAAYMAHHFSHETAQADKHRRRALRLAPLMTYFPAAEPNHSPILVPHVNHLNGNAESGDTTAYLVRAQKYGVGRRLFVTKQGGMGLASGGVKKGDWVCGIGGGWFVLRSDKQWRIVGDCYWVGSVEGEETRFDIA